jgi:hypothetical protein
MHDVKCTLRNIDASLNDVGVKIPLWIGLLILSEVANDFAVQPFR